MKRFISLLVLIAMLVSSTVAFAEEVSDAQQQVEQVVTEMTVTDEENAYKDYFESAFVIVRYTRNACVNTSNYLVLCSSLTDSSPSDNSFLLEIESPLELTEEQMEYLYAYKLAVEESSSYKSYLSSTMDAAMNINRTLPAYLAVFALLEKPTVPEKYAYVDSCIDQAIAEAQAYSNDIVAYLSGTGSKPEYDETMFEYLDMINDLL